MDELVNGLLDENELFGVRMLVLVLALVLALALEVELFEEIFIAWVLALFVPDPVPSPAGVIEAGDCSVDVEPPPPAPWSAYS